MKTVTTNSDLVKIYDYNTLTDDDLKQIRKYFEERKLVVIDNFQSNEEIEYINKNINLNIEPVRFWDTNTKKVKNFKKYKKFKNGDNILKLLDCSDKVKDKCKKILNNSEDEIFSFINDKLQYKIESKKCDYRFTNTINEDLHFDNFEPNLNNNAFLRVFCNLDNEYRIWNNSLNIYEYIDLKKNEICKVAKDKKINLTYSGENRINDFIFKDIMKSHDFVDSNCEKIYENNLPKVTTKFAPGSIWICDSIINSHQVIFGNKCTTNNFEINSNSFSSLDNIYKNKITPIIDEINKKIN